LPASFVYFKRSVSNFGSVSENTFGVLSHEPSSLRSGLSPSGLSPSGQRLGMTLVCDDDMNSE